MKHRATVTVPATTTTKVTSVTCDFCGAEIPQPRSIGDFKTVRIECDEGFRAPEGGGGQTTSFDCCYACWVGRVTPSLEFLGAESQTKEWDF